MSKPKKMQSRGERRHQYAALPFRFTDTGKLQVLLLTSRTTRRWVIPKGWPIPKLSPRASAAREAHEEAGLEGVIESETPIGHYYYDKRLDGGGAIRVQVAVFLLKVSHQLRTWPEQAERETHWYDPEEAAERVEEPELATILRDLRALVCAPQ